MPTITIRKSTSTSRESLVAAIDLIRRDREAEEKSFKAALELKTRREAAWKTYGEAADALKAATKKPAKKAAAKKRAAKKPSAKKSRPVTLTTVAHANEVSDPSVLLP